MNRDNSHTLFSDARKMLVWAIACLLLATGLSRATMPAGLDTRVNIGAYLNGALPLSGPQSMPLLLSQTGAFIDTPNMVPHPGLIPYDLNSPLWSDAAFKQRWIALPFDGTPASPGSPTIGYLAEGKWTYPNGTVFVKHFGLVINEQTSASRRLETRLLVRDANGGVYGASYRWKPDNSDAEIVTDPQTETGIEVTRADGVTKETQNWLYPGQDQCITCHNNANPNDPNGSGMVLGLKSLQLNKNYTYQTGRTDNQLNTWSELGMFNTVLANAASLPRMAPLNDSTATLEHRVRSYVDSNCAFCHQPDGPGPVWDARFTTPILSQNIAGDVTRPFAVLQRFNLAGSRMHIRDSVDPRVTAFPEPMPPIARNVPHTEWLAVMGAWANYPFDSVEAFAVNNPTKLTIRFDRAVDANDAALTASYAIDNGINVTAAAVDPMDATKVILTTTQMTDGSNYRVTINRLRETTAPYNPIWPNTFEDFTYLAAPLAQTINFGALIDKPTTSAAFSVSATGGASGQPVVFSSLTSSICTVSGTNGATVTLAGTPGLCTIAANQAGSNTYAAAVQATQSFTVLKVFNIVLEGSQEVPLNVSNGGGGGTATYDVTTKQLKLNISYSGMEGTENNAHIHGPAARGVSAGVLFPLTAGSPKTDTVTLDAAQEPQLLSGQLYVNVHSTAYPGGELRGQIDALGSAGKVLKVLIAGGLTGIFRLGDFNGSPLNCESSQICLQKFAPNQSVKVVSASYDEGVELRWSGCDSSTSGLTGAECNLTMNQSRLVYASFNGVLFPPTVTGIVAGNNQATVAFNPPPFAIVGGEYIATCAAPGNPTASVSSTVSPITLTGLMNGVTYSCSVTHETSNPSNAMIVTPFLQLALLSLKSRKTHAGNSDFDLTLLPSALNATPIEPRSIGRGHKLLFEFNQPVTAPNSVTAKDANNNVIPNVIHSTTDNIVTVILPNLADNQRISITLAGINGNSASNVTQEVGFLVGDINGSGTVTAADIMALKARASTTLTQSNFRFDLNLSGKIDGADVSVAKARSATKLP